MMKLSEPWYTYVRNGTKTIELRIYDQKRRNINIGDKITFTDTDGNKPFVKVVKGLYLYPNFKDAIVTHGLNNVIPNAKNIKEALSVYHSIPSYKEGAIYYGVLAIDLA